VRLGEAVVGEGIDLVVDPACHVLGDPVLRHAGDELLADGRHAFARALVSHGTPQVVGLAGGEACGGDRHLHPLFLEERDA
jgi:hypothetical protein